MSFVKSGMNCLVTLSLLILAGCASQPESQPPQKAVANESVSAGIQKPLSIQINLERAKPTGGVYNVSYGHFLFSDRRAYRLGDILTVTLEGEDKLTMDGGTTNVKNNTITIPDPTILGKSSATIFGGGRSLAFDFAPIRTYGGTTDTDRGNKLQGSIAVKVISVQPNGTLRVQGEKWLTINNNRELIQISGLVRPEDIDTENKVKSERLADSKLEYIAVGQNADIHKPGWMTRALNSSWFPF